MGASLAHVLGRPATATGRAARCKRGRYSFNGLVGQPRLETSK